MLRGRGREPPRDAFRRDLGQRGRRRRRRRDQRRRRRLGQRRNLPRTNDGNLTIKRVNYYAITTQKQHTSYIHLKYIHATTSL
jgi:hypothetical protein